LERGGYVIHQSVEIGYRVSDITGSEQMYNTLVDLRTGPRFLEQSLSMQSQNHDSLQLVHQPCGGSGHGACGSENFLPV
jgi:hypothetical protein